MNEQENSSVLAPLGNPIDKKIPLIVQRMKRKEQQIFSRIDLFCAYIEDGWGLYVAARKCGFDWNYWRAKLMEFPRVQRAYKMHMNRRSNRVSHTGIGK